MTPCTPVSNRVRRVCTVAALLGCAMAAPPALRAEERPKTSSGESVERSGAVRLRFERRPVLEIGDALRVELGGRLDTDLRGPATNPTLTGDRLDWSGRRLEIAGRVTSRVSFEVSRDLGVERGAWRDVFVDVQALPHAAVRGGQFKVPFSEERTRGGGSLDFVRRSLAARVLAPGRDVGVMGHGRLGGKRVTYDVGVFQGRGDDTAEDDPVSRDLGLRPLWAARVTARPFAGVRGRQTAAETFRIGASVMRGENRPGLTRLGVRSASSRTEISAPAYVGGPRTGLGLEWQWSPGPFRLAAEWIEIREAREGQAIDGSDLVPLIGRGWYASAVWRVVSPPRKATASSRRSWLRSLELGARVEGLAFGTGTGGGQVVVHPRADELPWNEVGATTLGLTWAVNRWGRIQVNATAEQSKTLAREWSSAVRFQIQM